MSLAYGLAARVDGAQRAKRCTAIEQALLHRHDGARFPLLADARDFRGLSLLEMAREVLEAEGSYRRGDGRNEVAQRALQPTSDFPSILANAAGRILRAAYAAAPQTFKPLGRQVSLTNFKPAGMVRIGDAPQLLEILEGGEFKRGAMADSGESIRLRTFGRVVGVTRQAIVNDDLGALTAVPEAFGAQASNLESNIVWGMILANPIMADGQPVFSSAHANVASAGAAPDVTTIGVGRTAMAKRTDLNGTVLNIVPRFLVTPPELELGAAQLVTTTTPAQTSQVVPEAVRSLTPISEPRLSTGVNGLAGSPTAWFLFASPAQIDTFAYAYLEGQTAPFIESRLGFDIDGVEIKARHDFGAGWIDHRGAWRNAGA